MPSYTKERVAVMLYARDMEMASATSKKTVLKIMAADPMGSSERALSPAERDSYMALVDELGAKCFPDLTPIETGLCSES